MTRTPPPGPTDGFAQRCLRAARELESARDLVRWGASRFAEHGLVFGHGNDNAIDEALAIVLGALHLEPGVPDALLAARLTGEEREAIARLFCRRVVERVPAAYLVRSAWFAGLEFYVDERVLVPRSPFAEWIERGFEPWLDPASVRSVLDVGTGSGCLAVACALAFPRARVTAVDVDAGALAVARRNVRAHGLEDRVRLRRGDVWAGLRGRFDLVISNPPYVDAAAMAALPPEYRHEPAGGLAAGEDGLAVVRRLLDGAPERLKRRGVLAVEVGASRAALERAFPDLPFVWLECARGGDNLFLLERAALAARGR